MCSSCAQPYALNRISKGNIGWALYAWISTIESVEDNTLFLEDFKERLIPDVLDTDDDIILIQLVLHKSISLKDLIDVFSLLPAERINESIEKFIRSGLVISENGNLSIKPFLKAYITTYLYNKKLLF